MNLEETIFQVRMGLLEVSRLKDSIDKLFKLNNMETKEMKIVPPEGYEIDKENSTFDCIKFKPIKKALTYEDVARELFINRRFFFITSYSEIEKSEGESKIAALDGNNCASYKQAEKLLAINKLMNVAKYLNGDWKPDWRNESYFIAIVDGNIKVFVSYPTDLNIHFKNGELAKQAIDILGEETIRLALSTDW